MDWLVVGLGNPGREYELTPHNVGFMVCDSLSSLFNFSFNFEKKFKGLIGRFKLQEDSIIVLKPMTYMNLSGESVYYVVNFFNLLVENIIVIHDDIDLPLGKIRVKKNISSGGHKGVESIISVLKSKNFTRVRIGVDKKGDTAQFVLSRFEEDKLPLLDKVILIATDAVVDIVKNGIDYVMNKYNGIKVEV